MDAEVLIWTVLFLGGSAVILVALVLWAFKKDREKMRADTEAEG